MFPRRFQRISLSLHGKILHRCSSRCRAQWELHSTKREWIIYRSMHMINSRPPLALPPPPVICIMIYILFVNLDRLIKTAPRVCLSFTGYPFPNAFINTYKYFSLKLSAAIFVPARLSFFNEFASFFEERIFANFPKKGKKKRTNFEMIDSFID